MIQYWLIVIFLRAHQTNTGSEKKTGSYNGEELM